MCELKFVHQLQNCKICVLFAKCVRQSPNAIRQKSLFSQTNFDEVREAPWSSGEPSSLDVGSNPGVKTRWKEGPYNGRKINEIKAA